MKDIYSQRILILDFGSQYTQLIARRVRELGVYCEIFPFDVSEKMIEDFAPAGIILSGGPQSATAQDTARAAHVVFELGCPVLGICYGMQVMAAQMGGAVEVAKHREFGYAQVEVHGHSKLLRDIEDGLSTAGTALLDVWMSHGDRATRLPEGFILIASTPSSPFTGIADERRQFYGLQFHPEVSHTRQGKRILQRFIEEICGCKPQWTPTNIIEESIETVRERVGNSRVILGLSGGVDSAVVAALLHRAIGDQLICVFVDTGLLRLNEVEQVISMFEKHVGLKVLHVSAEQRFLAGLVGIEDPEEKRRIIGRLFIEVFEEQAKQFSGVKFLAQGTIYTDVIESAAASFGKAHVIKTHHNVGGLPEKMNLKLIEPLRELFKDEVRRLGLELGLPYDMLYRHPFPGPGLAIRVLGEVRPDYLKMLREADTIFLEELHKAGWYQKVGQAFAVFLPIKSVGVVGDARQYEYVIALRAVETADFMTAHWARLPVDLLAKTASRIVNEIAGISRVVYDITDKPPATIEWE